MENENDEEIEEYENDSDEIDDDSSPSVICDGADSENEFSDDELRPIHQKKINTKYGLIYSC